MGDSTGLSSTDTYAGGTDFSALSDHPIEQADWLDVNNRLRQHGFDPVILSHPSKLNRTNSGFVILEEMVAFGLRNTVETLLADCERKQGLMQELVSSSNKLQRELDEERTRFNELNQENTSLKTALEAERIKMQEIEIQRESELKNHAEHVHKLEAANSKIHLNNRELAQENNELLANLQQEMNVADASFDSVLDKKPREDNILLKSGEKHGRAKKMQKNAEIFQEYDQKLKEMHHELENLRLKVIDKESSEATLKAKTRTKSKHRKPGRNISELTNETFDDKLSDDYDDVSQVGSHSTVGSESNASIASTLASEISDAGFLYKRLKLTERKFKEAKKLIKELSEDNAKLTAEMKKRPKQKEWRKTLVLNKQMENLLRENNLSPSRGAFGVEESIKKCTHVDGIDFLPIDVCRGHLKDVCIRMDVTNINDIPRKLDTLEESFQRNYAMEKILRNLLRTVQVQEHSDDASMYSSKVDAEEQRDEHQWKCLIPTVKVWRDELRELTVVSDMIKRLSELLLPWKAKEPEKGGFQEAKSTGKVAVDDLKRQIQVLAEECKRGPVKHRRGQPNKDELIHVVEHFMKLFDVEDISGTFARMNDVYVKQSEMVNVLHTIKDLLGLEKNAGASNIVNSVGTLAKAKHLLHVSDLDNVITRLDQYDEFYLAFKSVISSLIEILGVDAVEEIVPAVRALVRFP